MQASKGNQARSFYTMPEYEAWTETVNTTGWKIKYYKGLGTSTEEEAQEYFADIDRHRKSFLWAGEVIQVCGHVVRDYWRLILTSQLSSNWPKQ